MRDISYSAPGNAWSSGAAMSTASVLVSGAALSAEALGDIHGKMLDIVCFAGDTWIRWTELSVVPPTFSCDE